jgi:hypothetical protein
MRDSAAAKMYVAAIPELAKLIPEGSGLDTHLTIRNAVDGLQDACFLRKRYRSTLSFPDLDCLQQPSRWCLIQRPTGGHR